MVTYLLVGEGTKINSSMARDADIARVCSHVDAKHLHMCYKFSLDSFAFSLVFIKSFPKDKLLNLTYLGT